MSIFPREQIMAGMELLRQLSPDKDNNERVCIISYPPQAPSKKYQNKSFNVTPIIHGISEDKLSQTNSEFTASSIEIYMTYDIINSTTDFEGTINLPSKGFKKNNVIIHYGSNRYVVEEEVETDMATGIRLFCNLMD